jgi:hypothetical protein
MISPQKIDRPTDRSGSPHNVISMSKYSSDLLP